MTWKPRHEAHAIERVRAMFHFREPLPKKILNDASAEIVEAAPKLGFDTVTPAESSIVTISLQPNATGKQEPASQSGFVLRRHVDGEVVEEVGIRDTRFGYMTTIYGRWENLSQRLEDVLLPALRKAEPAIELVSMKLEYWDRFLFDGAPEKADVTTLLEGFETALPADVLAGQSAWHSHIGWFEGEKASPVLINRNLDMLDQTNADGETVYWPAAHLKRLL